MITNDYLSTTITSTVVISENIKIIKDGIKAVRNTLNVLGKTRLAIHCHDSGTCWMSSHVL